MKRIITNVEEIMPTPTTISGYLVTLDCGHTQEMVPHVTYKVGWDCSCSRCWRDAQAKERTK